MKLRLYRAHIWCVLFIISVIGFTIERHYLIQSITQQDDSQFLVIDDSCFFLPKSLQFEEAHELHFDQAQLACEAFLNRGPEAVDSEKRLERLFHPEAYKKAQKIVQAETVDFKNRSIHQKMSIAEISQLKMKDDSVLIQVVGQLIRTGRFMDKPFVEVLEFECQLHFVLNRKMIENGRYPTVVYNFNLKTKPTPSS